MTEPDADTRATEIEKAFRIADEIYLIGSFERGVTVYSQQLRATNLLWALARRDFREKREVNSVAVIGGGIAGLTAAACAMVLYPKCQVTLFEKSTDLAPLQQGCDTRWLHPRIYDWPALGSRAPSASLPVLNWTEGRASDIARQTLLAFSKYASSHGQLLKVNLGVKHLKLDTDSRTVEWTGHDGIADGHYFRAGRSTGENTKFGRVILAVGFGLEAGPTLSYWKNETIGQPMLNGAIDTYVISGYGDGALVDLCRLTIERFRQDRILYDLFGDDLESLEEQLRAVREETQHEATIFPKLETVANDILQKPLLALRQRLRKDTRVVLHLPGRPGTENHSLTDVFGNTSSFANRVMLYLLYRCGAFIPHFGSIDLAIAEFGVHAQHIIRRHGPTTEPNVRKVFMKLSDSVESELTRIKTTRPQVARRLWDPGSIPAKG